MSNIDKLKEYKRILCIVESPNKVKSISKIFKDLNLNNIIVKASVGHISYIKDSGIFNMGIDPETFKMDLDISEDKKKVVYELKSQVDVSDFILIASDPDREGEAIAWSLKKFLKIKDNNYQRIVYHEITKSAIENALNNPLKINESLVKAAHTRSRLDKIVGYRLSPIARNNINARSVGRCQSAGLKLIVDREKEINSFKPETFYELYLNFEKNSTPFKAKYQGNKEKDTSKIKSLDECNKIIKDCSLNQYIIDKVESKELNQNSPLPFTTSSFQQECASKLNLSVKKSMMCAQKLFEGLDMNGDHIALTTYLRTDSTFMSNEFVEQAKNHIIKTYGNIYYQGVKKTKKKENAQEGHECLRIIDISMTPNKLAKYIEDKDLIKVYTIIYNRTLASLMTPRKIFETIYTIKNNNYIFTLSSKEEKFDGWRKLYNVENDKEELVKETFIKDEVLHKTSLETIEKQTQPPSRYSEASIIKTLDNLGIGRPSTYATIISTLLDEKRGYCNIQDKKIVPTELAINLINFLGNNFKDIVDSSYTSNLEKSLDIISEGKLEDIDFLKNFYTRLDNEIKEKNLNPSSTKTCPNCGAQLVIRRGKFGSFLACPNYPKCKYTEKLSKK